MSLILPLTNVPGPKPTLNVQSWRYGVQAQPCPTASGAGDMAASKATEQEEEAEEKKKEAEVC
jgi:hypothetical protein